MNISKSDVIWSYAAQFFNVATGVLVLPLLLRLLSTDEIAFYYIIMNIGILVNLFDFGFSAQFSRNFAYVFNGAQELRFEGLSDNVIEKVNYKLLKTLISTAASVYRVISFLVIVVMLSLGTFYIKKVTNDFTLVNKSLYIWIFYTISVFFNMYFMYLNPMVMGKGLIKRNQQAIVISRLTYLLISFVLLKFKFGLFSIVLANLCAPFVSRIILSLSFYSDGLKKELKSVEFSRREKKECLKKIWYNAKKIGVAALGSFGIQKSSMFFAGLFLTTTQIASFGLLQQFSNIVIGLSITLFNTYTPRIAGHCVDKDLEKLKKDFSFCLGAFYIIFIILSLCVIFLGPISLKIIKSNAVLPTKVFMILFFIIQLLEQNHGLFATIIALNNKVPYVKPSLISGAFIVFGLYISLRFTSFEMWSLILVPGVVQLLYNNWKWPKITCSEYLHSNFFIFVYKSLKSFVLYVVEKINLYKKRGMRV